MGTKKYFILSLGLLIASLGLQAGLPIGIQKKQASGLRVAAPCVPPSASAVLDINNVRALLHNGGDMWWDLSSDPRYEVPKGSNRHSMFAASLWIGGVDKAGQLRVAAQTYRQSGIDYWAGPLTDGGASTDNETCGRYNKMFKINKTEIDAFRADLADNGVIDNPGNYPNVNTWPAVGNPNSNLGTNSNGEIVVAYKPNGTIFYLAPFVDVDGDLLYNPSNGDYPDIPGDQGIWWVLNDKGDVHTETGGEPIGVEIHMLAFAFTTANAINDMTFYRQVVINRSNLQLNETYIGQWVDVDIGFAFNDYVGCDTNLGLGYGYNATADDAGANGYGLNPPAAGVDFFQGPLADPFDGEDNDGDGIIDEDGETIIMSKFVYYNNDFSLTGNPVVAQHYYGYLTGFWKDGTPLVDNFSNGGEGNGYGPSSPGPATDFMFSGDPCVGIGWTESNANNPTNEDRRFLQSAGPFTLQGGAVNEIVVGVVWARGFYNDQFGSVCELLEADRVAQALFDNNFQLLNGPDAPELEITEYDSELMLRWFYPENLKLVRNNFDESYRQADPVLKANNIPDSVFTFQGYIVYQLIDQTVGPNELNDPDRARIVAQCDIADGVKTIVNRTVKAVEGFPDGIIVDEVMVQGADQGIFKSISLTRDLFALSGDNSLKNYTIYYYGVFAYAYNDTSSDGRQFVPGNRFFRAVAAMPHIVDLRAGGTVVASAYGDGIEVTQVAGVGNGGHFVRISAETEAEIMANGSADRITYQAGAAPIEVKVVDPEAVKGSYYKVEVVGRKFVEELVISEDSAGGTRVVDSVFAEWELFEGSSPDGPFTDVVHRSTFRERNDGSGPRPLPLTGTEQIIENHGISIAVRNAEPAGDSLDEGGNSGVIGGEITFEDNSFPWLTGLPDNNDLFGGAWNWIQSDEKTSFRSIPGYYDKFGDFQTLAGGRIGPYFLTRSFNNDLQNGGDIAPAVVVKDITTNRQVAFNEFVGLDKLHDIDIVFTSDQSKWSRCIVIETSPNDGLGSGAWQLSAKWKDNVDKNGKSEKPKELTDHGMGWFPGYAIDINTGRRLNIFFGESEWDVLNNGSDMIFNPTADFGNNLDRVGGRHYIWVTNQDYDGFVSLKDTLTNANYKGTGGFSNAIFFDETGHHLKDVYKYVTWVAIPMLNQGFEIQKPQDFPTDARMSVRLRQQYRSRQGTADVAAFTFNTIDLAAESGRSDIAKGALDKVLVVPNPYYAYSSYETGQLDNIIKITNLPQKCRISIFSLNGFLVRQYNKDSVDPDQRWDLKNQSGVPVGSGVYIIHVNANVSGQNLGEKIIKLFMVKREIDLDSF